MIIMHVCMTEAESVDLPKSKSPRSTSNLDCIELGQMKKDMVEGNVAYIHLKLGREGSQGILISISKPLKNSNSIMNPKKISETPSNTCNEPCLGLISEVDICDTLLMSFSLDCDDTPSLSQSKTDHVYIDVVSENSQTALISLTSNNRDCSQSSVICTLLDSLESCQITEKSHDGKFSQNPTYVNLLSRTEGENGVEATSF